MQQPPAEAEKGPTFGHALFLLAMLVTLGAIAFFAPRQFVVDHFSKFVAAAYVLAFASLFLSKDKLLHIPTRQEIRKKGPTAVLALLFVIAANTWLTEIDKYERLRLRLVHYCTIVRTQGFGAERTNAQAAALDVVDDLNSLWTGERQIMEDEACSDRRPL